MALGVTVDINAHLGNISGQVDQAVDQLNRFQQQAESMSSKVGAAFKALGVGLSVGGIVTFLKSGIDAADALNDMADRTGIAVEQLAGLQLGLKLSDSSMEAFAASANKLSANIGKNREEFARLGITAKDPIEAFLQLADVFKSIQDPQTRAALGVKVLNENYAELAPLLLQGSAAIREQMKDGLAWSGNIGTMSKQAAQFNDQIDTMKFRLGSLSILVAGPILDGFTQLTEHIADATEKSVTFNNVMKGIGDFVFQRDTFTGLTRELSDVTDAIERTEAKIKAIKNDGAIGGLIDGLAGSDINLEKNRLDNLLKERQRIIDAFNAQQNEAKIKTTTTSDAGVKAFLGIGEEAESANRRAGASVDALTSKYNSLVASLQREIALHGDNSEAAKMEYEVLNGSLQKLSEGQKLKLLNLAAEKDAIDANAKAYEEYDAIIEESLKLAQKQIEDTAATFDRLTQKFDGARQDFIAGLGDVQDALNLHIIDADRAKVEFDKLGQAYNDSFIDPAKKGTDELSKFADQAARNMQDAFANFLFDPFQGGLTGMLDGFITTLRRMAAEASSAYIFDALKSSFKDSSSSGSDAGGFFSSLFSLFSSSSSGSTFQGNGPLLSYANAVGNIYDSGNVVPFAKGGVFEGGNVIAFPKTNHSNPVIKFAKGDLFDQPTKFPMAGGRTGLMGEAGPEAIMPLTRGPDGKLGVKSMGGGQHPAQTINITVNVQSGTAPDVRRAAGQGAREALGLINGASRYV